MKTFAPALGLLVLVPWSGIAIADDDEPWHPTAETKRFDASAEICMAAKTKAQAEAEMQRERSYSKRYGVTDLGRLNFFKESIMESDEQARAASATLRKEGLRQVPCRSALLLEFESCVAADEDSEFSSLSVEDRKKNCHERGFGIPASPRGPQSVGDQQLEKLAQNTPPSVADFKTAQAKLARAGVDQEPMNMALVCASDLSVMTKRPLSAVTSDLVEVLQLRSPAAAARRLSLTLDEAFGSLVDELYPTPSSVAALADDHGFKPLSLLRSICKGVATRGGGNLGVVSMRAKGSPLVDQATE